MDTNTSPNALLDGITDDQPVLQPSAVQNDTEKAAVSRIIQKMDAEDREAARLRTSLEYGVGENPDQAAEVNRLARERNVAPDIIRSDLPGVQREQAIQGINPASLVSNSPITARFLANPDNAAMAHDNTANLSALEQALQYGSNAGNAALSGIHSLASGAYGMGQAAAATMDQFSIPMGNAMGLDLSMEPTMARLAAEQDRMAKRLMPKSDSAVESGIYSGIASLAQTAAVLPAAIATGNPFMLLAPLAAAQGGNTFHEDRSHGIGYVESMASGTSDALAEAVGEIIPAGKLLKDIGLKTGFVKTLANQIVPEVVGEQVTQAWQDLNEWAVLHPEKSFDDYLAERPNAALQTFIATLVGVGGNVGVAKSMDAIANRYQRRADQMQQAEQHGAIVAKLTELAKVDKVLQRDASTWEAFAKEAAQDGISEFYFDGPMLFQSGLAPKLAELLPDHAAEISEAVANGGIVSIPTEQVLARVSPSEVGDALIPYTKLGPNEPSLMEAEDYYKSGKAEELQADLERAAGENAKDAEFRASKERVQQRILDDMTALGLWTPEIRAVKAALYASYAAVRSVRLNMTIEQFDAKHGPRVQAEDVLGGGGPVLDQGNIPVTDQIDELTGLPLNEDGTVTVYHHTSAENAERIRQDGWLRSAGEPDLYFTTQQDTDTGYGDTAIPVRVKPERLQLDDEFPDGRADYRVDAPSRGRRLKFLPDGSAVLNQMSFDGVSPEQLQREFEETRVRPNDPNILHQKELEEGKNAITGDLSRVNEDVREAVESFLARRSPEESQRIRNNLDHLKGTTWSAAAVKGMAYREMLYRAMEGRDTSNLEVNEIWGKQDMGKTTIIRAFKQFPKFGDKIIHKLIDGYDFVGGNRKAENDISTSFGNCNPSPDCAMHCYAAGSTARPSDIAKSEFTEFVLEHYAERTADRIREMYEVTAASRAGLSLRLNDKGDLSEAQLKLIAAMNEKGIAMQVFSKRPDLLRQVDDVNLKMLSVDGSNLGIATDNPDLRLAVVITDEITEEMLEPLHDRVSVYLPVNLKGNSVSEAELKSRFPKLYPRMKRENLCPVDGGKMHTKPGTSFVDIQNKTTDKGVWTCTSCDLFGMPGCFHGDRKTNQRQATSQANAISLDSVKKELSIRKAKLELEKQLALLKSLGEINDEQYETISRTLDAGQRDLRTDAVKIDAPGSGKETSRVSSKESAVGAGTNANDQGRGSLFQSEGLGPRGSFNPETNTITLLKNADLSTFEHELGHYFFENDIRIASDIVKQAQTFGFDSLTEGERDMLNDVSALMTQHGIQGDIAEQLDTWHSMDFEEQRAYHENTAEWFEQYLFSGKAPSLELAHTFQRLRDFMVQVYQSLKNFLNQHPNSGKLSDEVRAVFDRMLATREQIELMEHARSMLPQFADQEKSGMDPDSFRQYQKDDLDASSLAIQYLQARGLKDMQWLGRYQIKALKAVQKDVALKRAAMKSEVTTQVMSQPVYRAWSFLTRKMTEGDRIEAAAKPVNPNAVDPAKDNLFAAIGKLGGIDKADLVAEGWIDDSKGADKPNSGLFGKPVWRVDGTGRSIDDIAQSLADDGYVKADQHGKADLADFAEKFEMHLRGTPQYALTFDYDSLLDPVAGSQVANPAALEAGRLDYASLVDMGYSLDEIGRLQAYRMVLKSGGMHPDLVSDRIPEAFDSGDAMIRAILQAAPPREAIEAETDRRMLETYGDITSPKALQQAADEAVHNEMRSKVLVTEANALAQAVGKPSILYDAAKAYANSIISRLQLNNIRPHQYTAAEVKAGKLAERARIKGDLATAAAEKKNQVLQNQLASAALQAKADVQKLLDTWKTLVNKSDLKLKNSYDMDLLNAVRVILGEYGIAPKRAEKASGYLDVLARNDPDMHAVVLPYIQSAEQNAKPFMTMTVEELRGLRDSIDSVLYLARRSRQLEVDGDLLDRQEVQATLYDQLEKFGIPAEIPGEKSAPTPAEQRMAKFYTGLASARRMENAVELWDRGQSLGPFQRFVWLPIKEAADKYRARKVDVLTQYRALFDSIAPTMKRQILAAPELGYTFGKDSGGSAVNEILHALLHTGNASNKRKLLLGRGWASELPDGTLDTSRWDAFIQRMANEGRLTQAHMDFVQSAWDLLESLKPDAQKMHREVFGKYFDEITAEPVNTPWGVYRGGYAPAIADSRIVQDAAMRKLVEDSNASMAYAFPQTNKGFTQGRVEYNKPLLLDLRSLGQHIDKVLLFSHMEGPVRDVKRILSGDVMNALTRIDPGANVGLVMPWLNRSARMMVETPIPGDAGFSRFLNGWRRRAGMALMFGNVVNTLQQVTGFSVAAIKVPLKLQRRALVAYLSGPKAFTDAVAAKSIYMANRMESGIASMNNEINDILLNPTLMEKWDNWSQRHQFFMQSALDNTMSPIIWMAQYNQAIAAGEVEKDAIRLADAVVRETQGSQLPEDVSRWETGNAFVRMFTQFTGYFSSQANLLWNESHKVINLHKEMGIKKSASAGTYLFMLGFMAPAVISTAISIAGRGGPDDDDKDGEVLDDWLAQLFMKGPAGYATAMLPFGIGQLAMAVGHSFNNKPYDDRLVSSPAFSMTESALHVFHDAKKMLNGEDVDRRTIRDVGSLLSLTMGIPAAAAAKPLGYLADVNDGKVAPENPADFVRGLVTGTAPH